MASLTNFWVHLFSFVRWWGWFLYRPTWKGTTTTQERGPWLDSLFHFFSVYRIPFWLMNPGWWALHVWLVPLIFLFWSGPCERDTQIWAGHGIWAMQSILYPFRPSSPRRGNRKRKKNSPNRPTSSIRSYPYFIYWLSRISCVFSVPLFLGKFLR